jgi:hypothetical protein
VQCNLSVSFHGRVAAAATAASMLLLRTRCHARGPEPETWFGYCGFRPGDDDALSSSPEATAGASPLTDLKKNSYQEAKYSSSPSRSDDSVYCTIRYRTHRHVLVLNFSFYACSSSCHRLCGPALLGINNVPLFFLIRTEHTTSSAAAFHDPLP